MKNKKNIILITIGILLLIIVIVVIKFKFNEKENILNGYYELEKIITYYNLGEIESEAEVSSFSNIKKLHITNKQIESQILEKTTYNYIIKDNTLYYSLDKINEKDYNNLDYLEYEINDDYLLLIDRYKLTDVYYYKKINADQF